MMFGMEDVFNLLHDPESDACWAKLERYGDTTKITTYDGKDHVLQSMTADRRNPNGYIVFDGGRVIYDIQGDTLFCADSHRSAQDAVDYAHDRKGNTIIAGIRPWVLKYTHCALPPVEIPEIFEEGKKNRAPVDILDVLENMATESPGHPIELAKLLDGYNINPSAIPAGETDHATDKQFKEFMQRKS